MNDRLPDDDAVLKEIDKVLERGRRSSDPMINKLAETTPTADPLYQHELEQSLIGRLRSQQNSEETYTMSAIHSTRPVQTMTNTSLMWAASIALIAISFITILAINLNQTPPSNFAASAAAQVETPISIVIAAQEIPAGSLITDDMVSVITTTQAELERLTRTQPELTLITDPQTVVGQMAAVNIRWFQPLDNSLIGQPADPCALPDSNCPIVPEGYYTILLPRYEHTLQGLHIGDRVDILASIDDVPRVITENVLLMDISADRLTYAVPSWQLAILISFYHTEEEYALRLHTAQESEQPGETIVDYVFNSPEELPDDYLFDLIVNVPAEYGYLLTDLPASIDHVDFTANGDTLNFWFKDLEIIDIVDGREVLMRVSERDAANLDYLVNTLEMGVNFIPDEDIY